jgi:hypothetical protein
VLVVEVILVGVEGDEFVPVAVVVVLAVLEVGIVDVKVDFVVEEVEVTVEMVEVLVFDKVVII